MNLLKPFCVNRPLAKGEFLIRIYISGILIIHVESKGFNPTNTYSLLYVFSINGIKDE